MKIVKVTVDGADEDWTDTAAELHNVAETVEHEGEVADDIFHSYGCTANVQEHVDYFKGTLFGMFTQAFDKLSELAPVAEGYAAICNMLEDRSENAAEEREEIVEQNAQLEQNLNIAAEEAKTLATGTADGSSSAKQARKKKSKLKS